MEAILNKIYAMGDPDKASWWENYVKHDSVFLGIPMKDLRRALKDWLASCNYSEDQKAEVVRRFFQGRYAEEKLLGILLMAEHMTKAKDDLVLDLVEEVIHDVSDWNICDWLCVKVLGPRMKTGDFVARLEAWSTSDYLWLRRASLVPFARVDHGLYKENIFRIASRLLQAQERFSKTAVGWILREMMPEYSPEVLDFLRDHREALTLEVLNNVLKHEADKAGLKRSILDE